MKFFIDEHFAFAQPASQPGRSARCDPSSGRLRDPDHVVFARAIEADRIIVTENADDFRKLAGRVNVHPGLIILPSVARAEAQRLMDIVIAHLTDAGGERPQDLLVNSVLTITLAADIRIDPLP